MKNKKKRKQKKEKKEKKANIKSFKFDSKSKTGKILLFAFTIILLSMGAYMYKQATKKPAEEPEVFVPLDSTKDEFLVQEEEVKIIEPKDEVIEVKDELEGEFRLKSKYEQDILNSSNFDDFASIDENKERVPKDKYEEAEIALESLIKEFNEKEGFSDKSDEEIWKKADAAFDELDSETDDLEF